MPLCDSIIKMPKALVRVSSPPIAFLIYICFWGAYFVLLWRRQLVETGDGWIAGWIGTWADGSAHLSYMSSFAFRKWLVTTHPLYSGNKFTYPFASDMIGGYLVRIGLPLTAAYELWGFVLSIVSVTLLFLFLRTLFRDWRVAFVGSVLFLLSGGLGAVRFFKDVWVSGLWNTLSALPREYTHIHGEGIKWINTVSGHMVPQRALLLGLPLGCIVMSTLAKHHSMGASKLSLALAGFLTGLLPIVHIHTLIVVAVFAGWLFAVNIALRRRPIRLWLYYCAPASAVGIPILIWLLFPLVKGSFISWHPGWLAKDLQYNFVLFWVKNWGVWIPLAVVGYFIGERGVKLLLAPFIISFVLANLILFQPYSFDNAKILIWVHLSLSGCAGLTIVRLIQKRSLISQLAGAMLLLASCLAGMLDCVRLLQSHHSIPMWTKEEVELAEKVREDTPRDAIFLTADQVNHWVPTLTGRQIVMGYRGWMWTYGFDYAGRLNDIREIYRGTERASFLLKRYGIDYVVIGRYELGGDYRANEAYFRSRFSVAFESRNYRVYKIGKTSYY